MGRFGEAMKLTMLLRELHAEKRWLDDVIAALEAAALASELAEPLVRRLRHYASRGRVVHLDPKEKAELARLARQVNRAAVRYSRALTRGPRLVRRSARTDGESQE